MLWYTRVFHMTHYESVSSLALRRVMKRFWSPFCRGCVGPDLQSYDFMNVFESIRNGDDGFTCQVNGRLGDAKLIEDFFIFVLCGFDIVDAKVESSSLPDALHDPCSFKGLYTLAHTRPFLGWKPLPAVPLLEKMEKNEETDVVNEGNNGNRNRSEDGAGDQSIVPATNPKVGGQPAPLFKVPFTARLEGSEDCITHLILRSPVIDVIKSDSNCPATVRSCLVNEEAIKALVTLRRANVSPELITASTLLGITAKKETWSHALGIL